MVALCWINMARTSCPKESKRDEKERDRDILQAIFDNRKHLCWSLRWPMMSVCQNCCCLI